MMMSAKIRFLRHHDAPERKLLREFGGFVKEFLEENLVPITAEPNFDEWLSGTHYSAKEKLRLKNVHDELLGAPGAYYKEFMKTEFMNSCNVPYDMNIKSGRMINGISDKFKVFAGRWIKAIEKEVYKLSYFAKHIPVIDRPRVIFEMLGKFGGPFVVTDYTSFESSFSPKLIRKCESQLVKHVLKQFPRISCFLAKQMWSVRHIVARYFEIRVPGIRMSGDLHTSLANGFTNLMLTLFCARKSHVRCDGFVEGDDGLFYFSGDIDFSYSIRLGFEIKKEMHATIFDTKFCGLCFSSNLAAFCDPRYELCKLGWSFSPLRNRNSRTRLGLLKAKALSLLYCCPRCPILTSAALCYLRIAGNVRPVFEGGYWASGLADQVLTLSDVVASEFRKGITDSDRVEFESMYGIDPNLQRACELWFDRRHSLGAIHDGPVMVLYSGYHRWHQNYNDLVVVSPHDNRI